MSSRFGGSGITHRVALELEVDEGPDQIEPEEWELRDLLVAMRLGLARPLRTIRGLVVDPVRDRLSTTLLAMAEDVDETAQLHWLATASQSDVVAGTLRSPRPSLEVLVELEHLVGLTRRIGQRLAREGL
jgi:hypothetical protein